MSGGIEGLGLTPSDTLPTEGTQGPQTQTVNAEGQQVTFRPSVSSLVEDAQEEVTEMLSEKGAEKLKHREAHSKKESRLREILRKYLENVPGLNKSDKFQQAIESLKQKSKPTPQQVRQQLSELKGDSDGEGFESGALLALEEALSAEGGNDELLAAVRQAKADLGNELKDFYQEQVKTFSDVGDVYQQLLGDYGEEDFTAATEMLIQQLGVELQSCTTSTDKNQLKANVDSLFHLEVARNTYNSCTGLVEKMEHEFGLVLTATAKGK